jgi:hypothetical protein
MKKAKETENIKTNFLSIDGEIPNPKCKYGLWVDTYNKNQQAFCLIRDVNGAKEVILSKVMKNKEEFVEQVNNLSKYFDVAQFSTPDNKSK